MKNTAVRSISRTFDILEYFRVEQRPLTLKALVDHFGYPLVSTADILKSLQHLGYLSFDVKSKTYLPAPRLFDLTSWMTQDLLDPFDLMKDLQQFHHQTGLAVLLGTTNDVELLTIVALENSQIHHGRKRRCLFKSGTGLALASVLDDEIVERLYRLAVSRGLVQKADLSLTDLKAQLAAIRAQGYIASTNCHQDGWMIVAMPLPVSYCNRRLAIGCSGPVAEIRPRIADIARLMRDFIDAQFNWPDASAMTAKSPSAAPPWGGGWELRRPDRLSNKLDAVS